MRPVTVPASKTVGQRPAPARPVTQTPTASLQPQPEVTPPSGRPSVTSRITPNPEPRGPDVRTAPRLRRAAFPPGQPRIVDRPTTGPVRAQPPRPVGPPTKATISVRPPEPKLVRPKPSAQPPGPAQPPGRTIRPEPITSPVPVERVPNFPARTVTLTPAEPPVHENRPAVQRRIAEPRSESAPPVRPAVTLAPAPSDTKVPSAKLEVKGREVHSAPVVPSVSGRSPSSDAPVSVRAASEKASSVPGANGAEVQRQASASLRSKLQADKIRKSLEPAAGPRFLAAAELAVPTPATEVRTIAYPVEKIERAIAYVVMTAGNLLDGIRTAFATGDESTGNDVPENHVLSGTHHSSSDGRILFAVLSAVLLLQLSKGMYWGPLIFFRPASICRRPSERPG